MTMEWIDGDACTLPTVERPLRLAEFDDIFEEAVRAVDVVSATTTRLTLEGPTGLAQRVRDLTDRESACCSFFTFRIGGEPRPGSAEQVTLDVTVPRQQVAVLEALTGRAAARARLGGADRP